ncbi:16S rRNA processing protein RimM [Baekduia soli]|uniref:Ribosome maturation factor RimM n=1 Tax=Baekduia soli TaxID=496014 RepID=A0A5B8U776_9ACTN|nr:ribosome maturation factor RimM [Baekduia soli]QEC48678.1 16S rRNA processing protein RimM [Baekduia soli]
MDGADPATTGEADALIGAGRVGRPHGLDGSFHLTQPRTRVIALGLTVEVGGRELEIVRRSGTAARPILRLAGITTREAIEALRGTELRVRRADAPALEEDEWLAEDLAGCRVVDGAVEVGVVRRLLAYPSCEVLEVAREGGQAGADVLVPLISDAVRSVDIEGRRIDVDLAFLGEGA